MSCRHCIDKLLTAAAAVCPTCHLPFWSRDVVRNATLVSVGEFEFDMRSTAKTSYFACFSEFCSQEYRTVELKLAAAR